MSSKMRVLATFGVRPDLIKMAPVVKALKAHPDVELTVAHTGQHYDEEMSGVFLRGLMGYEPHQVYQLVERKPEWTTARLYAEITKATFKFTKQRDFDHVLVYGDHLAAQAVAVGTHLSGGPVLHHLEAGLRSYDLTMPEEMARMTIDSLAEVWHCPTEGALNTLVDEGHNPQHVHWTGNTVVDAVREMQARMQTTAAEPDYVVVTLHRPENVDEGEYKLERIVQQIVLAASKTELVVKFLVHPRTRNRLRATLDERVVRMMPPVCYESMLQLVMNAKLVVTDSGGLQEEACILRVPCVTIRKNTERPETLKCGANVLVTPAPDGSMHEGLLPAFERRLVGPLVGDWEHPYGREPAKEVVRVLVNEHADTR